jgi:hypothetical protein
VKTKWFNSQEQVSLAASSKEDYGSKKGCFANDDDTDV